MDQVGGKIGTPIRDQAGDQMGVQGGGWTGGGVGAQTGTCSPGAPRGDVRFLRIKGLPFRRAVKKTLITEFFDCGMTPDDVVILILASGY